MAVALVMDDVYQVRLYTVQGNQCAINRFHLEVNNIVPGAPTDFELAVQLDADIQAAWKACFVNAATYHGLQVQRVVPAPMPVAQSSTGNAGVGTRGGNPLPGNVSAIGKWLTPFAGRKFRGRFYVPFPSQIDGIVFNTPGATLVNNINTFTAIVVAGFTITHGGGGSAGLSPVLLHPDRSTTPISGSGVEPVFGSCKRRGGFGRANTSPI